MKYSNPLTQPDIERYVRALAAKASLSVVWHDKDNAVYTDGKRLYLPILRYPLDEDRIKRALAHAEHEVSHVIHSDFTILKENGIKGPDSSPLAGIYNVVEDHRIEFLPSDEYVGTREILDWHVGHNLDQIGPALAKNAPLPPESQLIAAMLHYDCDVRSDWMSSCVGIDYAKHVTDPDIAKNLAALMRDEAFKQRLRDLRRVPGVEGGALAWEYAKELYERLVPDADAEQEIQRMKDKAKAEGDGEEGEEGDGKDGAESKAIGKGKAGSEGKEPGKDKAKGIRWEYTPHDSPHKAKPGNWRDDGYGRVRHGSGVYVPCRTDEIAVHDLTKSASLSPDRDYIREVRDTHTASANVFANKVRTLLQVRSQKHYTHGHKSGKLHGASLHRIEANIPGYSERVFRQKHQNLTLDTSVAVVVDMSGSMSGSKIAHAGVATALLNHSLGNLLRIPMMIFGFSGDNTCDHYVFRTFNEKLVPEEKFMDRFATGVSRAMRQNLDGEAVLWGYKHLTTTKNKRKVLIVLSDGQPAAMRSGDSGAYLKQVCSAIDADPRVDMFGIGLMDDSVTRYYKHHTVIRRASELEHQLITVIQSKII